MQDAARLLESIEKPSANVFPLLSKSAWKGLDYIILQEKVFKNW